MRRALLAAVLLLALLGVTALGILALLRPPRLSVPEARDHIFRDVILIDTDSTPRPVRHLVVRAGRIDSIDTREIDAELEADAELAGLYVVPGLVDMHVHYPPAVAIGNAQLWSLLLLAHGVTSVREVGSVDGSIFGVREAIRAGAYPGPRIFACGRMIDGAPASFQSNRVVRDAAEARSAAESEVSAGADCIKAYNMLSPEALAALRAVGRRAGVPVIGHAPHSVPLEEVGLADLQHGTGAVRVDRAKVGRLDFRFEDWKTVDDARIAHVARISREQGIAHTPTLINSRMRVRLVGLAERSRVERDALLADDTGLRHLPRFWIGVWSALWGAPFAPSDTDARHVHDVFRARQAALTAGLHAAGVRIHAGTDTLMPFVAPGSSLHGELAELVRAGLKPASAWRIATREAGAWLGEPGLGTLAPGAPADLVFLRRDPRDDLEALTSIEAVLADGRLYRRADLDTALARCDAHFGGRFYETVMGLVVDAIQDGFAP